MWGDAGDCGGAKGGGEGGVNGFGWGFDLTGQAVFVICFMTLYPEDLRKSAFGLYFLLRLSPLMILVSLSAHQEPPCAFSTEPIPRAF